MKDDECVEFLQWALPRLRMRWPGFRKVRRQVCKRVSRRLRDLGLAGVSAYRHHLETHPEEWTHLDSLCRITISRFCRDRDVFEYLAREVLPDLAGLVASRGKREIRAWSIGCAAGEEPYTLSIAWELLTQPRLPGWALRVVATDADQNQLARAGEARYPAGSLKQMPPTWREAAFEEDAGYFRLRRGFQSGVEFQQQDIREAQPGGVYHLVLCRNLVFTYFSEELQREITTTLYHRLTPGGVLVLGKHERLPPGTPGFTELAPHLRIYRRQG